MDYFTKNKASFWVIVLLIGLNILTLGSMWFMHAHRPPPHHPEGEMFAPRGKHGPPGGEKLNRFLKNELQLSDEQNKRFKELRQQHREKMRQLREELHQLHEAFHNSHTSGTPNKQQLEQKADELTQKERELKQLNIEHFLSMRQLLQPEQRQRFDELFKEMRQRKGGKPRR